jgi:four helix bundle protein
MHRYERLLAWQRCHELTLAVYRTTERWPSTERFGLISQIRRAAASAATNVVEGLARRGPEDFARFLRYSVASLAEVSYQLRLATDLGYLVKPQRETVIAACNHAMRVTWKLCCRMERRP